MFLIFGCQSQKLADKEHELQRIYVNFVDGRLLAAATSVVDNRKAENVEGEFHCI
jgi:hypothetical protein